MCPSVQVPPWLHGFAAQSSTLSAHVAPAQPCSHAHEQLSSNLLPLIVPWLLQCEKPTIDSIRGTFTRMGFDAKETVCLIVLGHQFGRCHSDVSGNEHPCADPMYLSNRPSSRPSSQAASLHLVVSAVLSPTVLPCRTAPWPLRWLDTGRLMHTRAFVAQVVCIRSNSLERVRSWLGLHEPAGWDVRADARGEKAIGKTVRRRFKYLFTGNVNIRKMNSESNACACTATHLLVPTTWLSGRRCFWRIVNVARVLGVCAGSTRGIFSEGSRS